MICFDNLWKTMEKKGFTTYILREKCGIDSKTIRRLRANENIETKTIEVKRITSTNFDRNHDDDIAVILNAYDELLNKNEVTETNIYSIYTTLCKDLRDHVINVATYHDLLLHLLDSVYEIKNDSKNLSWKLIEQGIHEERVKQQMNKIYSFMKKEIRYRNNVLHDMDFLWIDNYLSIEINQLCNLFVFEDNEMIKLLEPLKKELVIQLQNKIHQIQKEEKERFDNIQKETNKLFEFLYNPFNEKVKVLLK